VLLVIGLNLAFTRWVIPSMDTAYLAEKTFGGVTVNDVRGVWSLIAAIFIAIVATIAMHWPRWRDLRQSINEGTMGSLLPIFNTASEVGYGSVIAALAAFAVIRDAVIGLSPGNPLLSEALAVNIMAGITGSSSGGLSIALNMLGKSYLELGTTAGISPQLLHRVAAVASGGLDSLPHNGAIITLLAICHLTHRESYLDIFVVSVVVPLLALVALLVLGTTFGTF
jgi:H+/gluconate symporter-like permease